MNLKLYNVTGTIQTEFEMSKNLKSKTSFSIFTVSTFPLNKVQIL